MTIKTVLISLILATAPTLALADCMFEHKSAATCSEGSQWDAAQAKCVPRANS